MLELLRDVIFVFQNVKEIIFLQETEQNLWEQAHTLVSESKARCLVFCFIY